MLSCCRSKYTVFVLHSLAHQLEELSARIVAGFKGVCGCLDELICLGAIDVSWLPVVVLDEMLESVAPRIVLDLGGVDRSHVFTSGMRIVSFHFHLGRDISEGL